MILHGMVASYQPDQNSVVGDSQVCPYPFACCLIRTQELAIKAIGNNYSFFGTIAQTLMLAGTGLAVVNDCGGTRGETRAQTNESRGQPPLTAEIVNRLPDIPQHRRLRARHIT